MKRFLSVLLVLTMLLSTISAFSFSVSAAMPSTDVLNGYENICLTYTYSPATVNNGRHSVDDLLPYTAYLDTEGNIQDFFFDSYLFLPCMDYGPSGARLHYEPGKPTTAEDWIAYVNDTFYDGANVDALNEAYGITKEALGDTESKAGVFFTIMYPAAESTNFGTLGGRSLNFSRTADRQYAVKWMIDEQIRLYNEAGYENLELVGFYWLEEYVYNYYYGNIYYNVDYSLFQYASQYLHSLGLKFIWIPYYQASGYQYWQTLGFDFASLQPNYFWSGSDVNRVNTSCSLSNRYGMGMEMEVDFSVASAEYYNRYLKYLEGGMTSGAMDSIKTYYQDRKSGTFYRACYSNNPVTRSVYDLTYKYAKGTLTSADIDYNYAEDFKAPDDCEWISYGKSYTACESYVDGNGSGYQNVSGNELTDSVFGISDLGTEWHAFHTNNKDSENRFSAVIDLGTVRSDLTHFMAHFSNYMLHGVGYPQQIRFYVSEDGVNYDFVAEAPLQTVDNISYVYHVATERHTGRYVKLSFVNDPYHSFVFCSEFLVGVGEPAEVTEPDADTGTEGGDTTDPDNGDTSNPDESPDTNGGTDTDITIPPESGDGTNEGSDNNSGDGGNDNENGSDDNNIADDKPSVEQPTEEDYLLGDVNASGSIDMMDYILLKRAYFGTFMFDDDQHKRADINQSIDIDMMDYILIKRIYFGTYKIDKK